MNPQKHWKHSEFMKGREIIPARWKPKSSIEDIIDGLEATCFEARNLAAAAKLYRQMIEGGDTIWLGVAGAGPVGGMGGYIIDLVRTGFVDAICTTGAQAYHDAHFAFGLPVVQGSPRVDDNAMDADGTTRIYDVNIRMHETLMEQDALFQLFANNLTPKVRSSAELNAEWANFVKERAPHAERSWIVAAYECGVPVFFDSESNHSIGMNLAKFWLDSKDVGIHPSQSLIEGAAIVYGCQPLGFFEWGGGGPKNWIQTLAPMISQILSVEFEGADRGIQVTTAVERDGGLSGCTFGEAVTWGKYKDASKGLVQVWGEYSMLVPLIVGYVLETCKPRDYKRLLDKRGDLLARFKADYQR